MKRSLIAAALLLTTPATAHEWYPADCCNVRDCYEISPQAVTPTSDGWLINRTGEVIGYQDRTFSGGKPKVRITPPEAGGTFHRCSYRSGDRDARTICLFVPPMGG